MKISKPDSVMPVTVILRKDNSTLVQYVEDGLLTRKYVPTDEVKGNLVAHQVLLQGIPFGYPWEDLEMKFDAQKFANEMRNVGLWTLQDVLVSPQKVWSALRATLAVNLSTILELSKSEKGVKNAKR